MVILWFFLGLVLLFLAASCFGMARSSYISAGERLVGFVLGSSLSFATFFLFIRLANLTAAVAGPMVISALLIGWFERKLGRMFFRIKAHGLNRKAPDK